MFLHVYFFQYVMEDEHTKEPLHNNPEEAADYVKAVNLLLQSFVNDIHGFNHYKHQDAYKTFSAHFIPASLQIGQRIFHQHGHRSCTQHNTRQGMCHLSCMS